MEKGSGQERTNITSKTNVEANYTNEKRMNTLGAIINDVMLTRERVRLLWGDARDWL